MPVSINGNGAISGLVITTADLSDGSVTTAKIAADAVATVDIADSAVTTAKIANANVTVAKISATGTASSTTFLRGDGSWQAVSSTPTTDQVLTATAGASVGAVGTYAFLITSQNLGVGSTVAGSNCRYGSGQSYHGPSFNQSSGTPSGTWRVMGFPNYTISCGNVYTNSSLFLRIS